MSDQTLAPDQTLQAMYAVIQAKAANEATFRAELLANPRAAVEKLFGQALPAHITLTAVAQPAGTYVIPVPTAGAVGAGGELSDNDLEAVAGGSKSGVEGYFKATGEEFVKVASLYAGTSMGLYESAPKDWLALKAQNIC